MIMRAPCKYACGSQQGRIETRGGQDCVYCCGCGRHQYNAPKTETGRAVRSLSTTHAAIRPKLRTAVLERANSCCEICHRGDRPLQVGHVVSVADGHDIGLPDSIINSMENLIAECDECNSGAGAGTKPLRMYLAILKARAMAEASNGG